MKNATGFEQRADYFSAAKPFRLIEGLPYGIHFLRVRTLHLGTLDATSLLIFLQPCMR